MPNAIDRLRRSAAQMTIRTAIQVARACPVGVQRSIVRSAVVWTGRVSTLRQKVRKNMVLALGNDVPPAAERRYLQQVGWLYANSLATFKHGLVGAQVPQQVKFDDSIHVLD